MKTYNHLESLIEDIADTFGEHLYDEIMQQNSLKLLTHYSEQLGVPAEHVQELVDDVNLKGW